MSATVSTFRECKSCRTRIFRASSPIGPIDLDWQPDGQGTWAAMQTATGGWVARSLPPGERPGPAEHRHARHECKETSGG